MNGETMANPSKEFAYAEGRQLMQRGSKAKGTTHFGGTEDCCLAGKNALDPQGQFMSCVTSYGPLLSLGKCIHTVTGESYDL